MADWTGRPPDWVVAPADGWVAPKGQTPDGRVLADEGRRVLGFLVDTAIWIVPQGIAMGAAVVAFIASTPSDPEEAPSGAGMLVAFFFYALVFLIGLLRLAVEAELLARRGRTWGMRAMKLRVVDARTGGPVSRAKAWGRTAFATYISSQLFGLGYWWAFWDDRKRTLHDLVCTTVVVDER